MSKITELLRLIKALPRGHRVFLRFEYDRAFSKLRHVARIYRKTALRRTRLVTVIGSLGKSTTHRAVMAALDCPDRKFSYSNYGTSLIENVLKIRPWDRRAALEVGISRPHEMHLYAHMIQPDIVVVTSISSDHFRTLPTLQHTRAEKVKMLSNLPPTATAILNGDDPNVLWMATQTQARIVTYGRGPANDVRAFDLSADETTTTFKLQIDGEVYPVRSRLAGEHMIYPILAAATVAHTESMPLPHALDRLAQLGPSPMRMEKFSLPSGITILDDSQKSGIETVHAAFDTMARLPAQRRIVVIGDSGSPDANIRDVYRDLGKRLATFADIVVCIGSNSTRSLRASAIRSGLSRNATFMAGARIGPALEFLQENLRAGDLILIKGSGRQRFQRITLALRGEPVACGIKNCTVKVPSCAECPLLNAPNAPLNNFYIRRDIEP